MTIEEVMTQIKALPDVEGVTLSGGEPMLQGCSIPLAKKIQAKVSA